VLPGRCAWDKRQRLLRAPEFAAFAPPQPSWRAARQWLALSAIPLSEPLPAAPADAAGVRFGITVSRRQARRAVARNMVKRVVREAARHRAADIESALAGTRIDVLFRLKAPLPEPSAAGWAAVKAQLRREADSLLEQLLGRALRGPWDRATPQRGPGHAARGRGDSLAQSAGGLAVQAPPTAATLAGDANPPQARNRA